MTPITVKEPCEAGREGLGLATASQDSVYPAGLDTALHPSFPTRLSPRRMVENDSGGSQVCP